MPNVACRRPCYRDQACSFRGQQTMFGRLEAARPQAVTLQRRVESLLTGGYVPQPRHICRSELGGQRVDRAIGATWNRPEAGVWGYPHRLVCRAIWDTRSTFLLAGYGSPALATSAAVRSPSKGHSCHTVTNSIASAAA